MPSLVEIEGILNRPQGPEAIPIRVSILRNVMIESIEPYLRYYGYLAGFNIQVSFGDYDTVVQDALGGNAALLNEQTDVVLIFLYLGALSVDLTKKITSLSFDDIRNEISRIRDLVNNVINGVRSQTDATIIWHRFELPIYPANGIADQGLLLGENTAVEQLNEEIRHILAAIPNSYCSDTNRCVLEIGKSKFYDARYWHIGRAPYSRHGIECISKQDTQFMRALFGKNKKCLLLDCDNTLWGGVIGEDGLSNIKLGKSYPGSCYYEFQQGIVSLYNRGIIIGLCSKNNEDDVLEVIKNHPDMLVREEHIAAYRINWQDKASNIRDIAAELNIGLDSIVFIDDSEFEINLIRSELPEVETILLHKGSPSGYWETLSSCGLFDTLTISNEDKKRGQMYKADVARKKLYTKATDMLSYFRTLEMKIKISLADSFSIPRVAQLTQKTNQFNLTTRRYDDADITRLATGKDSDVLCLHLTDKFSELGIVGVSILRYESEAAYVDSFLMSCRVLGRGVESVLLHKTLRIAQKKGCKCVLGTYIPTRKNSQVADFYLREGFEQANASAETAVDFRWDLSGEVPPDPDYFVLVESIIN